MPDRVLQFLDQMVRQSTFAVRLYSYLSAGLVSAGIIVISLRGQFDLSFDKAVPLVISIFGLIPLPLALLAQNKKSYFVYLRDSWNDAHASNDGSLIDHLKERIEKAQDVVAERGLGLAK